MDEQALIELLKSRLKIKVDFGSNPNEISTDAVRIRTQLMLDDEVISEDHTNFRLDGIGIPTTFGRYRRY